MNTLKRRGFTLIELVVIITILGILAAFAIPRFASLETEAQTASRDALAGSVRSAAALANALWLANGGRGTAVVMDGYTIDIANGYPTAETIVAAVADSSGYTFADAGHVSAFSSTSVPTCKVTYAEAAADAPPIVAVVGPC